MKASEGLVRVQVDGDKHGDLMQKYNVKGYPTILFFDPDGKQVGQLGSRQPGAVKQQLEQIVASHARK